MCIKTCEVLSTGLDVKVTDEWENQCSQHLFPKEERDRLSGGLETMLGARVNFRQNLSGR